MGGRERKEELAWKHAKPPQESPDTAILLQILTKTRLPEPVDRLTIELLHEQASVE